MGEPSLSVHCSSKRLVAGRSRPTQSSRKCKTNPGLRRPSEYSARSFSTAVSGATDVAGRRQSTSPGLDHLALSFALGIASRFSDIGCGTIRRQRAAEWRNEEGVARAA